MSIEAEEAYARRLVRHLDAGLQGMDPETRAALAPLAGVWAQLPADQRASLIRLGAGYARLNHRQRRLFHERLPHWVTLTDEQRALARENYRRLEALPLQERSEILQRWQAHCANKP